MGISDWSSDVCSSDLARVMLALDPLALVGHRHLESGPAESPLAGATLGEAPGGHPDHRVVLAVLNRVVEQVLKYLGQFVALADHRRQRLGDDLDEIGRAACRERVCQYV